MFPRIAATVLHAVAAVLTALPWPVLRRVADALAWLWRSLDARESRVARRNLELAYPDLMPAERAALHAEVLEFAHPVTGEAVRCTAPVPDDMKALIKVLHDDTKAAKAAGRG